MIFNALQQRTLTALCETLIPGVRPELPGQIAQALASSGNPADLDQFRQALDLIESPVAGLLLDGRFGRFSALGRPRREAVLRRWAAHPLPMLRQAFQAFKRLTGFLHYAAAPFPESWRYSGTSSDPARAPALQVEPLRPGEEQLDADAVVVGSGAGGGVAAAGLAARGLKVIVLEKGGYFPEAELGGPEIKGMQELYLDRGMCSTRDLSVSILAGSSVGGGTLINWTAAIAPPMWLRAEWEQEYGLDGLTSQAFQACVAEVSARLGVNADHSSSLPGSSAGRLLEGCRALGYAASELPRNATGCGEDCGACTFGCRAGAKQSTARTYLADAVANGARIIPRADVRRVLISGGRVTGVEALADGRPVTVRAPRVVMAAGAVGTPAILLRSGLENPWIGRNLKVHPVMAVTAHYADPVYPWSGRLLPAYSNQFARSDGNYGFLLEVAPVHPGLAALTSPWESGAQYERDVAMLHHLGVFIALVRDRGAGRVTVDRAGRHRIDYRISPYDMNHLLAGQRELIRVHAAAGARRIMTLHSRLNALENPTPELAEAFAERSARLPSRPNDVAVFSAHQMGTCRMGRSPKEAAAAPHGELFGAKGLYAADASAFPAASGVNPMLTIMSLAQWVTNQIQ